MPFLRISLFTRIVVWSFLNVLFVLAMLWLISFVPWIPLPNTPRIDANQRIESVANLLIQELADKTLTERDAILARYGNAYRVTFSIHDNDTGDQLGGEVRPLPAPVTRELRKAPPKEPPDRSLTGLPGLPSTRQDALPAPGGRLPARVLGIFSLTTHNPTHYWVGARVPIFVPGKPERIRATLLASSDSPSGNGLFFTPWPWATAITLMVVLSMLFWLPFVSRLTRFIGKMTRATEHIADERFDVRVNDQRSDELGRLGKAINHLTERLSGFVTGQRRFLGDISHELNTPLARMQVALGILEDRVVPAHRAYVTDVQEEVQLMSKLVTELLDYSKAGIKAQAVKRENVALKPLAQQVIARESAGYDAAAIAVEIDDALTVHANAELLARALGNVLRNTLHYAGAAGPITLAAHQVSEQVSLRIVDCGPGVPEAALNKLFDPFYRLETDRARATGGAGLGLAIVKSCIEACQGSVTARNRQPHGLEVIFTLPTSEK
ncbi:MAG: HAMP domain-containing histidine kinase [Acidobacteria bacterium]|nr:HAMP domain-containing histidine kinase [Acidobacteriota bacterium]